MLEFFLQYGLFLLKAITIVICIAIVIGLVVSSGARNRGGNARGHISVKSLNKHFEELKDSLQSEILSDEGYKAEIKAKSKADKKLEKEYKAGKELKRRVYVINFDGDIEASAAELLRQEVTAVLTVATPRDEVVVNIESPGGMVHAYGFAASQLERIKTKDVPLTVCVDKVAASGGYMMACIADRLIAAPFAVIGSIGVMAQVTNVHKLLTKHDVDHDIMTAGEFKQSLTMFGENTEKMKQKLQDDLEDTHVLFKEHVSRFRPGLDISAVATGEIWYGQRAIDMKLIDDIKTSDDYLLDASEASDIFQVNFEHKESLQDKLGKAFQGAVSMSFNRLLQSELLSKLTRV